MNIQEAKEEIIRTVKASLARDEAGMLLIPRERQRPVLLMGPPGIGKTALMRQIAKELGISLVSYTITHHTRQSAIGLPKLTEREYGGERHTVTEYTMSEIVAAVYEQIERSGIREGILFLDEINCVSETLAPTMLQFLQYKTFGTHAVPEGFVIVTAGNPPEYNRSVREFDLVTLDRLKRLDVEADFPVWHDYAVNASVHDGILTFLELKKDCFYSVRTEPGARRFVTARGWEDLSDALKTYERLALPVTQETVGSFLQDREIAETFYDYYRLWLKYRDRYRVSGILAGEIQGEELRAPFDEKLSLVHLLAGALAEECGEYARKKAEQRLVFQMLKERKEQENRSGLKAEQEAENRGEPETNQKKSTAEWLADRISEETEALHREEQAKLLSRQEQAIRKRVLLRLRELLDILREEVQEVQDETNWPGKAESEFERLRKAFADSEKERLATAEETGKRMERAFTFLNRCFGEGQELVLFLKALSENRDVLSFVRECGCEAYYHYNRLLLLEDRRERLKREILELG